MADFARRQYPNVLALLETGCELVEDAREKTKSMLASAAQNAAGTRKSGSASRIQALAEPVDGMGHRALWHCYAITAGIVVHGEWFEGYRHHSVGCSSPAFESLSGSLPSSTTLNSNALEESNAAQLRRVGMLLTDMWSGVLALSNDVLRIDSDDRASLEWWLEHLRHTFAAVTMSSSSSSSSSSSTSAARSDLQFTFSQQTRQVKASSPIGKRTDSKNVPK
jgi:hypothetical protein